MSTCKRMFGSEELVIGLPEVRGKAHHAAQPYPGETVQIKAQWDKVTYFTRSHHSHESNLQLESHLDTHTCCCPPSK